MLGTVAYGAQEALQLSHRLNCNQSATSNCFRSSDFTVRETILIREDARGTGAGTSGQGQGMVAMKLSASDIYRQRWQHRVRWNLPSSRFRQTNVMILMICAYPAEQR